MVLLGNYSSSRFVLFYLCIYFLFLQNKPHLVEPIDFENFILKNKTLLQNDPQRELLLYPQDDISVSYQAVLYCLSTSLSAPSVSFIDKLA